AAALIAPPHGLLDSLTVPFNIRRFFSFAPARSLCVIDGIEKINLHREASRVETDWENWPLASVNDHVVRLSVMTRDFHWHRHCDSDEMLMPVEGSLIVDFEDKTLTVDVGEFVRVPRNVLHRTRPAGDKVVTLSFEHKDTSVTGS
ncbi:MAG TPA: cupin domain-containing protein, partial [Rudaea sp.]|nr:cupin domain-containing protein [Rudaea sp.]